MAACGVGVSLGLNSNKEVEVTGLAPDGYALKSGKLRSASGTRVVSDCVVLMLTQRLAFGLFGGEDDAKGLLLDVAGSETSSWMWRGFRDAESCRAEVIFGGEISLTLPATLENNLYLTRVCYDLVQAVCGAQRIRGQCDQILLAYPWETAPKSCNAGWGT